MINIKSFVMKLLSISIVVLMSFTVLNINVIEAKGGNDSRSYEFTVPATVSVKGEKPSFEITGEYDSEGYSSLTISVLSQNGFNLVSNEGQKLPYELEKGSTKISTSNPFSIVYDDTASGGDTRVSFTDVFFIKVDSNSLYAGNYKDVLTFEISTELTLHTVTYHTNDGTITSPDVECVTENSEYKQTYTVEDTIILPTNVTKEGYTFEGWYTTPDFANGPVTSFEGWKHYERKFYAKWDVITINETPIEEEETPTEEVTEEIKEEEPTEQEIVEEEKKEEETIPEVVEEIVNEEEAND